MQILGMHVLLSLVHTFLARIAPKGGDVYMYVYALLEPTVLCAFTCLFSACCLLLQ